MVMADELYYVYAFARDDGSLEAIGSAVDPRYPLEMIGNGRLAALASRVGLDQFDLSKLQSGTADVEWLSQIAVRHNAIVGQAARSGPVLPMRMGVLFRSRESLLARIAECHLAASDFLSRLGDRQEWGTAIYLDEARAEQALAPATPPPASASATGAGATYLAKKRERDQARRAVKEQSRHEVAEAEAALSSKADSFCSVRVLPSSLTGRREKMVWNGAFLISQSACPCWLDLADCLAHALADKGLLLETTGPWPAYHFCPEMT
jgi:hypothetical protein